MKCGLLTLLMSSVTAPMLLVARRGAFSWLSDHACHSQGMRDADAPAHPVSQGWLLPDASFGSMTATLNSRALQRPASHLFTHTT